MGTYLVRCSWQQPLLGHPDYADARRRMHGKLPLASPASAEAGLQVTALAWAPDSERLAVGQSDAVVYVYLLEAGGKKSICNKIVSSAAVNSLAWPAGSLQALLCGCTDGKVPPQCSWS